MVILQAPTVLAGHGPLAQSAASLSSQVKEYVRVDAPVVALTGVRVIDGTGATARDHVTIVIRDGRIVAVGSASEITIPQDAEVLALEGHTVVPGFVGLHDHTFYMSAGRTVQLSFSAPRLYLGAGVTTIRTTGSIAPYTDLNLKHSIDRGEVPGPRMYVSGPYLTGDSGMMEMRLLHNPDEARRAVEYWAAEGVSWFKAYDHITRDQLAALIETAHGLDIKVTGHLCSVTFSEAATLGIDNLEHGFLTATDFDPDKQPDVCPGGSTLRVGNTDMDGEAVRKVIRQLVEHGVALTSTLAVFETFVTGRPPLEDRMLEALAPHVREEVIASRQHVGDMNATLEVPFSELLRKMMQFEHDFAEAGGLLAAGVDPTGIGAAIAGFGDQRNYELLLEAGFAPHEAIRIMTSNGAEVLGALDDFGTVEVGKLADLVVIDGDPVNRPADIRNVVLVFKEGVGYDPAKLIDSVKGTVGLR